MPETEIPALLSEGASYFKAGSLNPPPGLSIYPFNVIIDLELIPKCKQQHIGQKGTLKSG